MNLIWDANTESDLGGYLILRGEAPGDTLQPLTPQPIHDTSFRDTTVRPGVRYVYAIVAVDRATPPNRSQPARAKNGAVGAEHAENGARGYAERRKLRGYRRSSWHAEDAALL